MLRHIVVGGLLVVGLGLAVPHAANAQQALSVNLGYFALRGDDARVAGDVLIADREDALPLAFRTQDFNGGTVNAEWLVGLGPFLEAGLGIGYYGRTNPSVYAHLVNSDGTEIEQDLKLRIVPFTATVRFLPLGHDAPIQPFIGAGVGVLNWRYSEIGDFVDPSDRGVFRARFTDHGTDAGPVVFGGLRFPVGDRFLTGGEIRYQKADGSLSNDFLGDKIDLGGYSYQAVFVVKF